MQIIIDRLFSLGGFLVIAGLFGLLVAYTRIRLSRRAFANIYISFFIATASYFLYSGLYNVTKEIALGPIVLGSIILLAGLIFYFSHRRGFDPYIDLGGYTQQQADKKCDPKVAKIIIESMRNVLNFHQVDWEDSRNDAFCIHGSSDEGIDISVVSGSDNLVVLLNNYFVFYNYFENGLEDSIEDALFLVHACLCSSTICRLYFREDGESLEMAAIEVMTFIDGEEVFLTPKIDDALKETLIFQDFRNNYISQFTPRKFELAA